MHVRVSSAGFRKAARLALPVLCALVLAPAAHAATPSIGITVSADPTESITSQLGITGTSASHAYAVLSVKPAGGNPCGANASADDGTRVEAWTVKAAGPFSAATNWTFGHAGSYVLCAWLYDDSVSGSPLVASATKTVEVRQPHLSLAVSLPATVGQGETFQLATTAQAEARRFVSSAIVPDTGRGCPPNWGAARQVDGTVVVLNGWGVTGGPFTDTENQSLSTPGAYLVCAYFNYDNDAVPQATASAAFRVVPPCVVPKLTPGPKLYGAKATLAAAGCSPGRIIAKPSRKYARGIVLRGAQKIGTTLPAQAPVGIVVSDGPPCVVPAVRRGTTVTAATRQLVAAGCTRGTIRRRADRRVRGGRVIAVIPRAGTTLAPRAPVVVLVSKGRGR